jgi:uncharacterized protein
MNLINARADVSAPNAQGEAPLFVAAHRGRTETVTTLLAMKAEPNMQRVRDDSAPIHAASKCGHVSCVRALIDGGAEVDLPMKGDTTSLYLACAYRMPEVALFLLERGASPHILSETKQSPLFASAHHGCAEALTALLKAGANANEKEQGGCSPLIAAVRARHANCVSELLKCGANLADTFQGMTALAYAKVDSTSQIVAMLEAEARQTSTRSSRGR